jgi:Protein of unknown function (DUF3105)
VHSLEGGAVWITYDPNLPPDQVEALRALTRGPWAYLIVSPYDGLPAPVDRARAQAIVVSTWDTEEHARWSPEALGEIGSRIQALGTQAEAPEIFEVIAT